MAGIGIDIGSTATKAVVADPSGAIAFKLVIPTGFSSVEVAEQVRRAFSCEGFEMDEMPVVATGYGRVAVPYANKVVTEITCHARGAAALFGEDGTVIDIGGQDTKAIGLAGGKVRGNRALLGDHGRPIGRKPSRARPLGGGRAAYRHLQHVHGVRRIRGHLLGGQGRAA